MDVNQERIQKLTTDCKLFLKKNYDIRIGDQKCVEWFHSFCFKHIKLILQEIQILRCNELILNRLVLLCNQLLTLLSLMVKIFKKEFATKTSLNNGRVFVVNHIDWCLSQIEETITKKLTGTTSSNGHFLKLVDIAIEKFSSPTSIPVKDFKVEMEELLEEIFSHAICIAQVSSKDDVEMIKGSSYALLEVFASYINEIEKFSPNPSMSKLFRESCVQKLCSLESKVNTTVLKLSLKVFANYKEPLENLYNHCINNNEGKLDELVSAFDVHVERIIQIGLFAISCSTCKNYCMKIENCLASLESLETELVPCLKSKNQAYSLVLKEYWLEQAEIIKNEIFCIIDPFAFCQVLHECCEDIVCDMYKSRRDNLLEKFNKSVEKLLKYANVLESFIITILQNEIDTTLVPQVTTMFFDFQRILKEVQAAKSSLLHDTLTQISEENNKRVYKRCKVLMSTIISLWNCFNTDEKNSLISQQSRIENKMFLFNSIKQSETLLKERSVLYRKSNTKKSNFRNTDGVNLLKHLHIRKLDFKQAEDGINNTIDVQISHILNDLTKLDIKL